MNAVTSGAFIKAYIIGLARGFFVDGLWGTLTLLWDIATLPVKLYGFGKHVLQLLGEIDLGAEMQKIASLMLDAGQYFDKNGDGQSLIKKLVESAKAAKIDDVADTFHNLYDTAKQKATELGGSVADLFVKFFSQKPEKIGEELGNTMGGIVGGIVGGIAFDALLGVVTAGAAAAAKTALASARTLVQPLLNLLIRTGQKAKLAVQGVWSYAKRITASARTGILTWIKKVSAELGAKAHAIVESIENFVERLLTRANKSKKAEAELASELAEQKAVQLVPAIAEAKGITAAHEKAGAPIHVLLTTLSALRKRFRWIKGFYAEGSRLVPGHKRIVMLASEHEIDADYDGEKEIPTPDWEVPKAVTDKLPPEWISNQNKKGVGIRWEDPSNPGNGIRIDKGNPSHSLPIQQVDHVVVRRNGKVIGRDGIPIQGSIKENFEKAHIPLSEYQNWKHWSSP